MKQFIRYLYEYGQGKRTRNVGFVKVEQDDRRSTIHIHGKGLRLGRGESLRVYLIFEDAGQVIGVEQGEIAYMGPAINYRLDYTSEDTGFPGNYDKINGILLENRDNRKFAALWEEAPADVENMRIWREDDSGRMSDLEEMQGEVLENVPDTQEQVMTETDRADVSVEEESYSEAAVDIIPEEEENIDTEDTETMSDAMVESQETCEADSSLLKATKIKRNEISRLPRCEWRLANNNFLLHGYHNYHYVALLDDGEVLRLGVPGIYHEKEAMAATGLGFPEFVGIDETTLADLADQEDENHFGFWCRQVRRPVR